MILVNGAERSEVPVTDRGLSYGDGVFRTMAARGGRPLHWQRQYAKLATDCDALQIGVPRSETLENEANAACAAYDACALKIVVTRGTGERGYRYSGTEPITRVVITSALPAYPAENAHAGIAVRRCHLKLGDQPALAGIKHLNRLENVMARSEWSDDRVSEGLLCDAHANVIGGTMSNLFIVRNGELMTPSLERCGVAGVTRERVIACAERYGQACFVGAIPWTDVLAAEEIFLTNSLFGIWPVREIDDAARPVGPVARSMQQALVQEDDAYLG